MKGKHSALTVRWRTCACQIKMSDFGADFWWCFDGCQKKKDEKKRRSHERPVPQTFLKKRLPLLPKCSTTANHVDKGYLGDTLFGSDNFRPSLRSNTFHHTSL